MNLEFCINAEHLRKALTEIEAAEANGFDHCLGVFEITESGIMIDETLAHYSDLLEKAHPTRTDLDWGRYQGVSKMNTFKDGELIPIVHKNA